LSKEVTAVFAREPQAGKVKTRLAKSIGDGPAKDLYEAMLTYTLNTLSKTNSEIYVYLTEESNPNFLKPPKYPGNLATRHQITGDLGAKMFTFFQDRFKEGAQKVVLVGSDCPYLKPQHLSQAFEALKTNDLVFGPAADGGYYLIGQSKEPKNIFEDINWSTETVLQETLEIAKKNNWTQQQLETLSDIDFLEDWQKYIKETPELPVEFLSLGDCGQFL
jgi:rSAM/selenodomain-associated transferase 1